MILYDPGSRFCKLWWRVVADPSAAGKIGPFLSHRRFYIPLSPLIEHSECGAMAQELCLPSSHFLRRRLFLVSGEEPCDHRPRQEDEHRLAELTRCIARHLLLDDAEVDKEMPEKAKGYLELGILGSTKKSSLALYAAPPEKNSALKCVLDPTLARQQLQAARFQHLKRLQAMKQESGARQSKNRGCGRGNGETLPRGCPLDLPPSAWPPLLKPPPPLPHHRQAMLLGISGGRKEPIGTGVFLPRIAATKFESRKKSTSSTDVVQHNMCQASTLNLSLNSGDDTLIARRNAMLYTYPNNNHHHHHHHHDHFLRAQPAAAADAPVAAHEIELPQEWTY